MRILFVIPGFSDGGAQRQCALLLNAMGAVGGVDRGLVRMHLGEQDELFDSDGVDQFMIGHGSNYDPRVSIALARTIDGWRPDVVFSWLHAADVHAFLAKQVSHHRFKWVLAERDSFYPRSWRYRLRGAMGKRSDIVIANSSSGAKYWENLGAKGAIRVATNIWTRGGATRSAGALGSSARSKTIVYVGRLEPQKDVARLITAFALLPPATFSDWRLRIVGKGTLEQQLRALSEDLNIADRVEFLGYRKDVGDLMAEARLFVSLSRHEGMPNVVMEAIGGGTPVVCTDIAPHRELLGEAYGFLVSDDVDPSGIAGIMEEAVRDPNRSDSEATFARARLAEMTPDRVAAQYIRIFKEIIG